MSDIGWPERFTPRTTDNYVSSEIIVAGLTAAEVWRISTTHRHGRRYYGNVRDIRFHDGLGPELHHGARFLSAH